MRIPGEQLGSQDDGALVQTVQASAGQADLLTSLGSRLIRMLSMVLSAVPLSSSILMVNVQAESNTAKL